METDPRKARLVGRTVLLAVAAVVVLIAPSSAAARTSAGAAKVDSTPPTVVIYSNWLGYTTRNTQPIVEFYGSDVENADSGTEIVRFEARVDDGAPAMLPPTATQFQPPSPLPDGDHFIEIRAIDDEGDEASGFVSVTIDTTPTPEANFWTSRDVALTGEPVTFDAGGSYDTDYDGRIVRYEWDLDGDGNFETDTGETSETSRSYAAPTGIQVSVRVTNDSGGTAVKSALLEIRLAPPEGEVGVSINGGDVATNDPLVTLTLTWPAFTNFVVISNDGGFGAAGSTTTVPVQRQVSWTLRSAGVKRAPRVVYVRFKGAGSDDQPYQDDIILDKRKPVVDGAKLATRGHNYSVALDATDDNSGVAVAEFYAKRSGKPIDTVRFASRDRLGERDLSEDVPVESRKAPKFVLVVDSAGNDSRLERIRNKHRNL